jgi:hypothetical protein
MPAAITLDLGVKARLSRVVINQRKYNSHYYSWGNPKTFEVWGTNNTPEKSGDWNEWDFIMDCSIIKPSGLPLGESSEEDNETAERGHDFAFSLDQEPLRYLRIKFTSVWTSSTFCHPTEITVYGDPGTEVEPDAAR